MFLHVGIEQNEHFGCRFGMNGFSCHIQRAGVQGSRMSARVVSDQHARIVCAGRCMQASATANSSICLRFRGRVLVEASLPGAVLPSASSRALHFRAGISRTVL